MSLHEARDVGVLLRREGRTVMAKTLANDLGRASCPKSDDGVRVPEDAQPDLRAVDVGDEDVSDPS